MTDATPTPPSIMRLPKMDTYDAFRVAQPQVFVKLSADLEAKMCAAAAVPDGPVAITVDPYDGWNRNRIAFRAEMPRPLDPAQVAAYDAQVRDAWETYDAALAAFATVTDPVTVAVLDLHRPQEPAHVGASLQCRGCDFTGYDAEYPDWPCRTVETVAAALGVATPDKWDLSRTYNATTKRWERP